LILKENIVAPTKYLEGSVSHVFVTAASRTLHAYVDHSTFLKEKSPIRSLSSHRNAIAVAAYYYYHVHLPFSLCAPIFWKASVMRDDFVLCCARTQGQELEPREPYAGVLQA
jgi:hypothetical protein